MRRSTSFSSDELALFAQLLRVAAISPECSVLVRAPAFSRLKRKVTRMHADKEPRDVLSRDARVARDKAILEECRQSVAAGTPWSADDAARRHGLGKDAVLKLTRSVRPKRARSVLTDQQMEDLVVLRCGLMDAGEWPGVEIASYILAERYRQPRTAVLAALVELRKRPRPRVAPTLAVGSDAARALIAEFKQRRYSPPEKEIAAE